MMALNELYDAFTGVHANAAVDRSMYRLFTCESSLIAACREERALGVITHASMVLPYLPDAQMDSDCALKGYQQ
jgi:hypothetical protein